MGDEDVGHFVLRGNPLWTIESGARKGATYYSSLSVSPFRNNHHNHNGRRRRGGPLYRGDDVPVEWKVRVGDHVAVHDPRGRVRPRDGAPYRVPWRPCRVLSLRDAPDGTFRVELSRCVRPAVDLVGRRLASPLPDGADQLWETTTGKETVDAERLLGPLRTTRSTTDAAVAAALSPPTRYRVDHVVDLSTRPASSSSRRPRASSDDFRSCVDFDALRPALTEYLAHRDGRRTDDVSSAAAAPTPRKRTARPTVLASTPSRTYYDRIRVDVPRANFRDHRPPPAAAASSVWTVSVGDLVAVHQESTTDAVDPFVVPWSVCRVLCLYRDANDRSSPFFLEAQWLYRRDDFAETGAPLPADDDGVPDRVFVTNHADEGVPSRALLAPATASSDDVVDARFPPVRLTCDAERTHSLPFARPAKRTSPSLGSPWRHSRLIASTPKLRAAMSERRPASRSRPTRVAVAPPRSPSASKPRKRAAVEDDPSSSSRKTARTASASSSRADDDVAVVREHLDLLHTNSKRKRFHAGLRLRASAFSRRLRGPEDWTARVGDVVAVSDPTGRSTVPFSTPWRAGRISLFHHRAADPDATTYAEVRWLERDDDARFVPTERVDAAVDVDRLLAPLDGTSSRRTEESTWARSPHAKRSAPLREALVRWEAARRGDADRRAAGSTALRRPRVDDDDSLFDHVDVVDALFDRDDDDDDERSPPSDEEEKEEERSGGVYVPRAPLHVNVSARRVYYDALETTPSTRDLAPEWRRPVNNGRRWRARLGDAAVARTDARRRDDDVDARARLRPGRPFLVDWSPVEIVSVWRTAATEREAKEQRRLVSEATDDERNLFERRREDDVVVEVRWLYRASDLPRSTAEALGAPTEDLHRRYERPFDHDDDDDASSLEEVFETDHVDDCPAAALMCPVELRDPSSDRRGVPVRRSDEHDGVVLRLDCRRFFSVQHLSRGAMLPCGDASRRTRRGRLYSSHVARDPALRAALRTTDDDATTAVVVPAPTTAVGRRAAALRAAVDRLTLSRADEDAWSRGAPLRCRESERARVERFLRRAVRGESSSMLVAGPPGTGKTASVLSVVAQLKREEAEGTVPEFHFVLVNAMELRQPFDAYVALWEEVSRSLGHREKRSPEEAKSRLERHFCGDAKDPRKDDDARRAVVVLLVDEIDHLVTQQQTVLYNLLDWPLRSGDGRGALAVVGVSNTINLPDLLTPRVQSRLCGERCVFQSYSVQQLVTILRDRLGMDDDESECRDVFEDDAVVFAARKVASVTGDVRKAFHVCRSAAERVLAGRSSDPVGVADVQRANRAAYNSHAVRSVRAAAPLEALLLVALASLSRRATTRDGEGGSDLDEVLTKMEAMVDATGDDAYAPAPDLDELVEMVNPLAEAGVVLLRYPDDAPVDPWPRIRLAVEDFAVKHALRDTRHRVLSEKFLSTSPIYF